MPERAVTAEAVPTTLDHLRQEFSSRSDARTKPSSNDLRLLHRFVRWCGPNAAVSSVTTLQITDFLEEQSSSTTRPSECLPTALEALFRLARDRGARTDNPMRGVHTPRGQGRTVRAAAGQTPGSKDSVLLSAGSSPSFRPNWSD